MFDINSNVNSSRSFDVNWTVNWLFDVNLVGTDIVSSRCQIKLKNTSRRYIILKPQKLDNI